MALLAGCISHDVKFEEVKYSIPPTGEAKPAGTSVVAVIDDATLAQKIRIKSWMSGIGNNWETEPGLMMKDVIEIEFPQAFGNYASATTYTEATGGDHRLTVVLTIPSYDFADFHASITVRAVAYRVGKVQVLDKTYSATGPTQGAKMFWGGAFAMKSALRQSSLAAYKTIFTSIRSDLQHLLESESASLDQAAKTPGTSP